MFKLKWIYFYHVCNLFLVVNNNIAKKHDQLIHHKVQILFFVSL